MDLQSVFAYARTRMQLPMPDILSPVLSTLPQGGWRERRLSAQEELSLFAEARKYSPLAAPLIELALETGMRRGEIARMTWEQVFLKEQTIHLIDTKNGDKRYVPLSARAEELLRMLPRTMSGPVFRLAHPDAITRMFTRICTRAGIANLRFHDLRREAASRIAPHIPATTLARIFGWSTPQMALRYYNPTARELVAAVRRAEAARAAA
jgi:integrase